MRVTLTFDELQQAVAEYVERKTKRNCGNHVENTCFEILDTNGKEVTYQDIEAIIETDDD